MLSYSDVAIRSVVRRLRHRIRIASKSNRSIFPLPSDACGEDPTSLLVFDFEVCLSTFRHDLTDLNHFICLELHSKARAVHIWPSSNADGTRQSVPYGLCALLS